MILELDVGNSRIKWRVLDASCNSEVDSGAANDLTELTNKIGNGPVITEIRASIVRNSHIRDQLVAWAGKTVRVPISIAKVSRSCVGVTNNYEDISRLGIDRWLAMLAAYHRAQTACAIIDCGTALTIDVLDASGQHAGGYIVPGLSLMRDSLELNTGIKLDSTTGNLSTEYGHSTTSAVHNGTFFALLALIRSCVQAADGPSKRLEKVYLTGGDASLFADGLAVGGLLVELVPTLVLDGLVLACPGKGAVED